MHNGFIIALVNAIVNCAYYLNPVEFFKFIAKKLTNTSSGDDVFNKNKSIAIDIFIVLKWVFVILIWKSAINNFFITTIVLYLIFTNVFTYFYYHIWVKTNHPASFEKNIRRFVNLILAYSFSNFCFGYLYAIPFSSELSWTNGFDKNFNGLLFSIANSLTSSVKGVEIATELGNIISVSQVSLSFMFISIILSKSIPQE